MLKVKVKVLLAAALLAVSAVTIIDANSEAYRYSRDDFPSHFFFGASTSAYQVEGAANEDGRTPSIFDTYAHSRGDISGEYGDKASDQYHKYKEDVALMAKMGLNAYRFSISWSRLIPNGRGPVNPKGLEYYNNLINELISHGIQPHVTLHHSDLPQALEDEYEGWLSRRVIRDFKAYADVCFKEFGDRVKYWTTLNEPNIFVIGGYDQGFLPPQRCSHSSPLINCSKGNSSTEPYIAGHNLLLAHASAATLYRKKYQRKQGGFVGINLLCFGFSPLTNKSEDLSATQRAKDFMMGWFLKPLVFGDYPDTMKRNAGSRLPSFTKTELDLVKGSIDFIGVNYYIATHVKNNPNKLPVEDRDFLADGDFDISVFNFQNRTSPFLFPENPWELQRLVESLSEDYGNNIPIYIHENGLPTPRNSSLDDSSRAEYLQEHIEAVLYAVRNGTNVKGYFVWSFLDVYELLGGYKMSFGLYYIDLDDPNFERQPKHSAKWYTKFLHRRNVDSELTIEFERNAPILSLHEAS